MIWIKERAGERRPARLMPAPEDLGAHGLAYFAEADDLEIELLNKGQEPGVLEHGVFERPAMRPGRVDDFDIARGIAMEGQEGKAGLHRFEDAPVGLDAIGGRRPRRLVQDVEQRWPRPGRLDFRHDAGGAVDAEGAGGGDR